jgi:hypothetical protein
MAHTAKQNPSNKVGRNSGAGAGGISEIVPTERERERGLEPISLHEPSRGWGRVLGYGMGALAVVGGGVTALRVRRARQNRGLNGVRNRVRQLLNKLR